jgi:hypothetical protein
MACNHQKIMSRGLWRAVRTATLLAGAGFSSVLMVNLPTASAAFVPASDKWMTQGSDTGTGAATRKRYRATGNGAANAGPQATRGSARQPRPRRAASGEHGSQSVRGSRGMERLLELPQRDLASRDR